MTIERNHPTGSEIEKRKNAILSRLELTSVAALVAYAAHDKNVSVNTVKEIVAAHFGVDDLARLPRHSYDSVIRFLVDLQVDMILN
jgi:hypothetical protein